MSEADRVFSARKGLGSQTLISEKRHILSAPRRSGPGAGKSRVVEVVHVRREGTQPRNEQPRPAAWNLRAETWPEGLRAKPAQPLSPQEIQPAVPDAAPPVVHVMPMWEPSPPQSLPPVAEPGEPPVETAVAGQHRPRRPKAKAPNQAARHFADPFADDDSGANCLRCGYLVEPVRERRSLLICSSCG
jgi:hypothetical protein